MPRAASDPSAFLPLLLGFRYHRPIGYYDEYQLEALNTVQNHLVQPMTKFPF
jgi:hypothetical protein